MAELGVRGGRFISCLVAGEDVEARSLAAAGFEEHRTRLRTLRNIEDLTELAQTYSVVLFV
jgi:hypothetical protein